MLAKLFNDEVLDSQRDLVCANRFQYNHLLERVKLCVPFSRQWHLLRLVAVEDFLKLFVVLNEVVFEAS